MSSTIVDTQKMRFRFLHTLYELTGGEYGRWLSGTAIGAAIGNEDASDSVMEYLAKAELLKLDRGWVDLTPRGVAEIERMVSNPTKESEYFPAYSLFTEEEKATPLKAKQWLKAVAEGLEIIFEKEKYFEGDDVQLTIRPSNLKFGLDILDEAGKRIDGVATASSKDGEWTGTVLRNASLGLYTIKSNVLGISGAASQFRVFPKDSA